MAWISMTGFGNVRIMNLDRKDLEGHKKLESDSQMHKKSKELKQKMHKI